MEAELKGKVALVTGAARGIGKGIALVLAEKGADVIVNDKTLDGEGEDVAGKIRSMGRKTMLFEADVSQEHDVKRMFAAIKKEFGQLDILVNNAGTSQAKDIFQSTLEDWQYVIDTNLTSCFLCSKEAMEIMAVQKNGRIVNISSVVGERGALFGHVHYAATKSGMLGITKTLARTGAPLGINVNSIAPGIIETELLLKTHGKKGVEKLASSVMLGIGQPRCIGLAVSYLCGEGGDYITGTTIDVNGGLNMR
jgi:NAD(P)-dependent dehydrogenase (short-subunit alcohol dehydrogenase family)